VRCAARLGSCIAFSLLTSFAAFAQTGQVISTGQVSQLAPGSCTTTVGPLGGSITSGPTAPYSGVREFSHTQTLADGTVISPKPTTEKVYRDSQDRVRTEHSFCRRRNEEQGGTWVEIRDPVSGYAYLLDPGTRTAHRYTLTVKVRQESDSVPKTAQVTSAAPSAAAPPRFTTESLGSQTMEGVPVEGERSTNVIAAGEMDNDRPFNIVRESWTSPSLHVVILSTYNDPRMGESTTRLTNIELSEPDPSLFEVPADYNVVDETQPVKLTFQRPSAAPPEK
jgi:hypothetical protein